MAIVTIILNSCAYWIIECNFILPSVWEVAENGGVTLTFSLIANSWAVLKIGFHGLWKTKCTTMRAFYFTIISLSVL